MLKTNPFKYEHRYLVIQMKDGQPFVRTLPSLKVSTAIRDGLTTVLNLRMAWTRFAGDGPADPVMFTAWVGADLRQHGLQATLVIEAIAYLNHFFRSQAYLR